MILPNVSIGDKLILRDRLGDERVAVVTHVAATHVECSGKRIRREDGWVVDNLDDDDAEIWGRVYARPAVGEEWRAIHETWRRRELISGLRQVPLGEYPTFVLVEAAKALRLFIPHEEP